MVPASRSFQPTLPRRRALGLLVASLAAVAATAACGGAATTAPPAPSTASATSAVATSTSAPPATAVATSAVASVPSPTASAASSAATTSAAAAAPSGITSVVWWFNVTGTAQQAWEQTVKEYQAQHPNIKVTLNPLDGHTTDQETKLQSVIAGGSQADLIYIHPIYNAAFATKGVIVPLEPYLDRSKSTFDLSDFYPGTIDYFRWVGKLWSLPNYSGPGVYYYNTDLLKRQGLADPWTLFQAGKWTMQEMDTDGTKVTTGQGATKIFARDDVSHSIRFQSPWIQGFGGQVWNADATKTLIDGPDAVKAWDYLAGQVTKGYAPGSADLKGLPDGIHSLFADGRLAFYFGIRSDAPTLKAVPFGTVPLYQMPDGKYYNRDGPNGLSITQSSKVKDDAWQFMTFDLTRGMELAMAVGFSAPTTRTLAKNPIWLNQLIPGENAAAYAAAAEQVQAILLPVRTVEIDNVIQDAYSKIVKGQATSQSAMSAVVPQINTMLTTAGQ
jgi:ABC-type glycerol-3-phosphate transport system substrate-binding protein